MDSKFRKEMVRQALEFGKNYKPGKGRNTIINPKSKALSKLKK